MSMTKLDFIKWLYEAGTRVNTSNPTYFKYWVVVGTIIISSAILVHILVWYKIRLPGFMLWIDDGWFTGFGSGIILIASLTTKRDEVKGNKEKKMPFTAEKDGI